MEGGPLALKEYQLLIEESDDIPVDRDVQGLGRIIEGGVDDEQYVEIEAEVAQWVNITRYSSFVYRQHSVAIVLFRDIEEGMAASKVKEAYLLLKAIPGAKALRSRFAVSLNRYPKEEIVRRHRVWTWWHSAWVYDERPPIARNEPNLPLPRQMASVPLRVWDDVCDGVRMPGSFIRGNSEASVFSSIGNADNIVLPPRKDALPAPVIETADGDGPMELRTDDEFQGEKEDNDETNWSDTDDEWLDLFDGIDLSTCGEQ